MIAATREYGRIPYVLNPDLIDITGELHQGRPVLVLLDIGLRFKPVWHYAVVIGYDPGTKELMLRSGTNAHTRLSVSDFMRSWRRADSWALVALRPGELPVNVDFDRYFRALIAMNKNLSAQVMLEHYQRASQHFPDRSLVWFALGNTYLQLKKHQQAVRAYLQTLNNDPAHIAARNNLAYTLSQLYCDDQALVHANEAVRLSAVTGEFELESLDTQAQIKTSMNNAHHSSRKCTLMSD